ncbi:Crp/Fnr family transcriptional regulator [Teredinibacter waterburyi]|jgi:cAMP-binding proteins - catabolite gene activator and regulatory subunit of cAMP-dependent protein kinases|uniref:Crp/Fnr family transcriptional regulator n=1 Tax=Teredinibacter waterburyi TaxID=1500538 RepID=UPI00165FE1CC|nr:cyclic nucleotide-binding domain-containing protein [Teredinibacter waterburyi]
MLKDVALFADVPSNYIAELERLSVTRKYPKNTILVSEGDDTSHLFIIVTGKVSVFLSDEEGRQVILNYMGPGEYFGELSLLDNKPRSASVQTLTPCEIISVSRAQFQQLLREDPDFALVMIAELTRKVRSLTDSVRDLALLDVYGRVSAVLEKLSDENNRIHQPKLTHQDIGNMVGSSREMVSRIMRQLVIGQYIEQQPGYIQINKPLPKAW